MKIPKCPQTISGKHIWELYNWLKLGISETQKGYRCIHCGLIDDRSKGKV